VSISSSLGVHTCRLENLQRLDVIFVEEVAKIGRHGDIKYFGFMRSLRAERPSRAPRTLSNFLVRHVPAVASCGNTFFHRTTNAAGKIEPGNWPVVRSDFPGYICSLMEKRVPTLPKPGRSTPAPLLVRAKDTDHRKHSLGEPDSEVFTDQRCSKGSPGVSLSRAGTSGGRV